MFRIKNNKTRYDLVDFDEVSAFNHPEIKFIGEEYNEKQFLRDKQKDISWLGLEFRNILYGKVIASDFKPLTNESAKEAGLPTYC